MKLKCKIEYVGKLRNGRPQYYCSVHKSFVPLENGIPLEECLCENKETYNNRLELNNINSIKIIYPNILKSTIPEIWIDNQKFDGVFEWENCLLNYKDFSGIMLSMLNNVSLERVKCSHCKHYHSDNGKFAFTPHRTHLCLYCGHLFREKEKNIGSELAIIYEIPHIQLEDRAVFIDDICTIQYDLFGGNVLINNEKADKIIIKKKEVNLVDFLNQILENEF